MRAVRLLDLMGELAVNTPTAEEKSWLKEVRRPTNRMKGRSI